MQIVIDISKEIYEIAKQNKWKWPADDVYDAIKNGTPLPKGHGRLFDERDIVLGNPEIIGNKIYGIEPIIEVDTAESEG